jgi:hypothetical protein
MNKRYYTYMLILVYFLTLYSCANIKMIEPGAPKIDMISTYFHGTDEIEISQSAITIEGAFKGLKKENYVDISECSYTYSKGKGLTENEEPFKFQKISILLAGKDQEGVDAFERLEYSNAALLSDYKEWNYNKSFGPISLDESLEFGFQNKNTLMTFDKKGNHAEITFTHSDMFGTKQSKFYKEGEKRDYKINIIYNKFNSNNIKLSKIIIEVNSSIDKGMGDFTEKTPLILAECNNFKRTEAEKD